MKTLNEKDFTLLHQLVLREQENYQSVKDRTGSDDWQMYINAMQLVAERLLETKEQLLKNQQTHMESKYWRTLKKGKATIFPDRQGKGGHNLPNIQIALPDNLRLAIWTNPDKGYVSYHLVEDTDEYREIQEKSSEEFKENKEATPLPQISNEAASNEDDDLPF